MSEPLNVQRAVKLRRLLHEAGDLIEALRENGAVVSLRVDFNEGDESIELHELNGDFTVRCHERINLLGDDDDDDDDEGLIHG